jgi:phosphoglycolate phosphatase-like HAD superfamily hydrolase
MIIRMSKKERLTDIQAVCFDCDGVLIDTTDSYDSVILETSRRILKEVAHLKVEWGEKGRELISMLRNTGKFNNDWDSTYALILFAVASSIKSKNKDLINQIEKYISKIPFSNSPYGYKSVDTILEKELGQKELYKFEHVKRFLDYPRNPPEGRLASEFDEIFCGPELYRLLYGKEPRYYNGIGFIERDKLIVKEELIKEIASCLNGKKLALFTGRPFILAKKSLKNIIEYFSLDASVFIGEMNHNPLIRKEFEVFKKPSGYALNYIMEMLGVKRMLYVGDSAEDIMSVSEARRMGREIIFAGVCSQSANRDKKESMFIELGADILVESVNELEQIIPFIGGKI